MGTTDKATAGPISGIVERRRKVADQKKADIKQVGEKLKDAFKK